MISVYFKYAAPQFIVGLMLHFVGRRFLTNNDEWEFLVLHVFHPGYIILC